MRGGATLQSASAFRAALRRELKARITAASHSADVRRAGGVPG
ncbi:hypothetical protein O5541_09005 [Escherichia coli]|nr:hypothetical protein [Escherichia coli]